MASYRITRLNPKSGLIEQPYRDKDGQFILADPVGGAQRHHAKHAVKVSTTAEAVAYLEQGYPIRMTDGQSAPSLVSAKSVTITPVQVEDDDESDLGSASSRNPPPAKEAVMDELKMLLCVQAGHIALAGSAAAAVAFIGFESKAVSGPYDIETREWTKVDLARFNISSLVSKAYDFAYQIGEYWNFGGNESHDVRTWVGGIPDSDSAGASHEFMGENGLCRRVADTAYARWWLIANDTLTIRELSLLANISESATRTALSREGLSAPKGTLDDALAWLRGRRGFIPTKPRDIALQDRTMFWSEAAFRQFGLAEGLKRLMAEWKIEPEEVRRRADVSQPFMDALMAGRPLLDMDALRRVGKALEIGVPQFVGFAVQEALRVIEATGADGEQAV